MRLKDKIAIVVGAGQSPGEGLGNGRATVLRFAQEGARVMAVDNNLSSAEETVAMARRSGGECTAFEADVTNEATLAAMIDAAQRLWGRIDVLHYNVGVSIAGGDAPLDEITEAAFDRIATINLRGAIMACKHVLPLMRTQRAGVIIMISSTAAWEKYPNVAYKATKAGIIAFTQQVAVQNAEYGVRANVILPGLMDTPMAVDTRARVSGKGRAEVAAARDARVPLRHKMGTAWDVANTVNVTNTTLTLVPGTTNTAAVTLNNRWATMATVKLGYAWDRFVLYGKGGGAWVGTSSPGLTVNNVPASFTSTGNNNNFGATLGVGVEWAFAGNWSARAEWDAILLQNQSVTVSGSAFGTDTVTVKNGSINTFTAAPEL